MRGILLIVAMIAPFTVSASEIRSAVFYADAEVVSVAPNYVKKLIKGECYRERVPDRRPSRESEPLITPGTIIGGALGGVLGAQIGRGHGKTAATIAGAVIGGRVGQGTIDGRSSGSDREYYTQKVCEDDYYQKQQRGYFVTVRYEGNMLTKRMNYAPRVGTTLRVKNVVTF